MRSRNCIDGGNARCRVLPPHPHSPPLSNLRKSPRMLAHCSIPQTIQMLSDARGAKGSKRKNLPRVINQLRKDLKQNDEFIKGTENEHQASAQLQHDKLMENDALGERLAKTVKQRQKTMRHLSILQDALKDRRKLVRDTYLRHHENVVTEVVTNGNIALDALIGSTYATLCSSNTEVRDVAFVVFVFSRRSPSILSSFPSF